MKESALAITCGHRPGRPSSRAAERSDSGSTALHEFGYQRDRSLASHHLKVPAIDAQHAAAVSLRTRNDRGIGKPEREIAVSIGERSDAGNIAATIFERLWTVLDVMQKPIQHIRTQLLQHERHFRQDALWNEPWLPFGQERRRYHPMVGIIGIGNRNNRRAIQRDHPSASSPAASRARSDRSPSGYARHRPIAMGDGCTVSAGRHRSRRYGLFSICWHSHLTGPVAFLM